MKNLSWYTFTLYIRLPICCILFIITIIATGCKIYYTEVKLLQNELANHNISCTLDELVQIYDGQILEDDPIKKNTVVLLNGNKKTVYWEDQNEEYLGVYDYNGKVLMNKQVFLDYFQVSCAQAQELEMFYARKNADWQSLILFISYGIMAVCFQITRVVLLQSKYKIGKIIYIAGTIVNGLSWTAVMINQNILYGFISGLITAILLICDVKSFLYSDLTLPSN